MEEEKKEEKKDEKKEDTNKEEKMETDTNGVRPSVSVTRCEIRVVHCSAQPLCFSNVVVREFSSSLVNYEARAWVGVCE